MRCWPPPRSMRAERDRRRRDDHNWLRVRTRLAYLGAGNLPSVIVALAIAGIAAALCLR